MRVLSALSHPSPWPTAALSPSHGFRSSSHSSSSSSSSSPPHLISSLHKNSPFCLRGLDPKSGQKRTPLPIQEEMCSKEIFPLPFPRNCYESFIFLSTTHRYFVTIASNGQGPAKSYSAFPTSPTLVSSVNDLFEFICSGPLIKKLGFTAETVAESIDKWLQCAFYVCQLFRLNDLNLSVPEKARIYHYYVPVFLWCEDQVLHHRSKFNDGDEIPPLVIGVSAPQGSGKTTLVFALEYLFRRSNRSAATLSIDDFYLTAEDQAELRSQNPGNALLEFRGNAGSHDLQFSIDTLTSLSKLTKKGMKMKLPRYDKSANGGRGDRADPSTWPEVEGPIEVVLFEGWMLGFNPLPNEVVKAVDPQLEVVNKNLEAYFDAWDKFVDAWIIIKIKDPKCVYQWRLQAEVAMREDGKPGMSDEEVLDFVSRYLPAYKAYLPPLYSEGPKGLHPDRLLVIEIDEERNPIAGQ